MIEAENIPLGFSMDHGATILFLFQTRDQSEAEIANSLAPFMQGKSTLIIAITYRESDKDGFTVAKVHRWISSIIVQS